MIARGENASADARLGATALIDVLERAGVRELFGLPGVHNLAIWKAASGRSLRLVGVRHEQGAAYAADGAARVTGRLGVALTTTGPGAANALGATGEAWASHSPVLVIATDVPSGLRRKGAYRGVLHETTDQAGMFRPVTKGVFVVSSAQEIPALTRAAIACAVSAPTGPAYLEIPTDLLAMPIVVGDGMNLTPPPPEPPSPGLVAEAAAMVRAAQRPLIWVGGGAIAAAAGPAVAELADLLGAPVLETFQGRGAIPLEHPSKVTLSVHDPHIGPIWDEADLVLAIGTDFDGMNTQNWMMPAPRAMIAINVDGADATKNYRADVLLETDALAGTQALAEALGALPRPSPSGDRLAEIAGRQRRAYESVREVEPGAAAFLDTLATVPAEVPIFADMCIPGYWTAAYHRIGRPRKLAYPIGWGTLGFAFPAAVGAALATSDPVLCIVGDGGFLFAAGELATVAQEKPPLTILLVDDGGYGMLRYDQKAAGDEPLGTDLTSPDFLALAASFGIPALRLAGLGEELAEALQVCLASGEPRLVVVEAALDPPVSTSPRWYRRRG